MLVMALMGVLLSHRTAGPLYHFKRVFDEIRSGNPKQRVRLRPKDEFQDVAKSFNDMMDSLQNPS
jgi:HAMP domain-containing protein